MPRPVHFEIHASDPAKLAKFYGDVFNWEVNYVPEIEYWLVISGDEKSAGINGGIFRRRGPKREKGQAVNAVGGPSCGYITRGMSLKVGSVEVRDIIVALNTQSKGAFACGDYSGNIGSGIPKRFIVTFDYENQIMYLKPAPKPVADTGTFDRSGMWINKSGDAFKIVDVTAGGPATQAGLKAGGGHRLGRRRESKKRHAFQPANETAARSFRNARISQH
ncbi:MAG: VOC family protein [Alphaproteobacteria bacterium]